MKLPNVEEWVWEWIKWMSVFLILFWYQLRPLTLSHVIAMSTIGVLSFRLLDVLRSMVFPQIESFNKAEPIEDLPLDLPPPPNENQKQKPNQNQNQKPSAPKAKKGGVDPVDPKAVKKTVRRNNDYGLSFMPPAEWAVPQPHPPVCLPSKTEKKQCPPCPIYSGWRDTLPYSVIAAGLPETKVEVSFDGAKKK
jgi:hypothetical protein